MQPMIEMLEGRQMFSVATPTIHVATPPAKPTISEPLKQDATLYFMGYAVKTDGSKCAQLLAKVTKSGSGYKADVTVNSKDGSVDNVTLMFDAKGHCVFDQVDSDSKFHLEAQVTSDGKISGNWIDYHKVANNKYELDSKGTVLLTRVTALPAPAAVMKFTGTAINTKGERDTLQIAVTKNDFGYRAEIKITGDDGHTDMKVFMFDLNRKLVYDGMDGGEHLHVEATMSADFKTLTGAWKSIHTDGTIGYGKITATRTA